MKDNRDTIIKTLIAVAWADGLVGDEERELIDTLLDAYEVPADEADAVRRWASTRRTLDEIGPGFAEFDDADRVLLLKQAVYATYVDGVQSEKELAILRDLAARLGIEEKRAGEMIRVTTERAKALREAERASAAVR